MSGLIDYSSGRNSWDRGSRVIQANQVLFWCYVIIITALISATLGAIAALLVPKQLITMVQEEPQEQAPLVNLGYPFQYRLRRSMNLLIMGVDRGSSPGFRGRSDTILLLRIDPKTQTINLLSIPRDTQVQVPQLGERKINEVNFLGGSEVTIDAIEDLLKGIQIDRYIRIQRGALTELVDRLGGLEVYVPQPMSYIDYTQGLTIELLPGWQTLNGQQAEDFVRFRGDALGDIGRVQRQQLLLKALQQRLKNPVVIPRLAQVLRTMEPYIDTNLSPEERIALMQFTLDMDNEALKMVMLPGSSQFSPFENTSYWIMDDDGRDRILREYFRQFWRGNVWDTPDYSVSTGRDPTTLRIAIQNATTQPELAHQVADYLESKGYYDLYFIPDWPHPLKNTQVVVQKGDIKGGEILLEELGIGTLEAMSTGDLSSDLTLRIGQDWLSDPSPNP